MPSERRRALTAGRERGPGWHSPSQVLHGALWEGCGTGAWPWEGEVGKDVADGDDDDGYIINIYIYILIWLLLLLTYYHYHHHYGDIWWLLLSFLPCIWSGFCDDYRHRHCLFIGQSPPATESTVETMASLRFLSSTSWPVQLLDFEALWAAWWPWVKKVMGISPRNSGSGLVAKNGEGTQFVAMNSCHSDIVFFSGHYPVLFSLRPTWHAECPCQVHLRSSSDLSVTKRYATDLPPGRWTP